MKRRDFLKTSGTGLGAAALSTVTGCQEKTTAQKGKTCLKTIGWVNEPAREIPVVAEADIVVLGGGPAGVAAAIGAARQGASVILLERQFYLGGLWTGGLVIPILNTHGLSEAKEWTRVIYGICNEICERLLSLDMLYAYPLRPVIDSEACKYILEQMLQEAGVRLIYSCQAASATMSGDKIESLVAECKSGRIAIKGKMFVDCSGDGDILDWTNEDYEVRLHHIGVMWRVGNAQSSEVGKTPIEGVISGHMGGETNQNGLDVFNLTRLQLKYRKHMWDSTQELRKKPGCENAYLLETPSQLGVRITRVMNSVYNANLDESMRYVSYDDSIGMSGGTDPVEYKGRKVPGNERPTWQIPYRALLPKRVENLLVAGRCFGFDEGLTFDAREVGTCLVTGQAAGTAAGIAINQKCSAREVDIRRLQNELTAQNVKLK